MWILTLWSRSDAGEAAQALSAKKVSKNISEGASSSTHLGAFLYSDLPLCLPAASFADLCALCAGVGVAAAGESPGQPLLS